MVNVHEGRVGGGILGLVSADGLKVSRVGDDNGAGAAGVCQSRNSHCPREDKRAGTEGVTYAFKASREVDIVYVLVVVLLEELKVKMIDG